jgi:transmembrane sensor
MSGSEPVAPSRDQLLQEAATWFARMRGPDAEGCRDEFEAWLRRGALHRQAYNRASEIFAMGKVLAQDRNPPAKVQRPGSVSRVRTRLAIVIGALLVLIAAGWLTIGRLGPDGGTEPIANAGSPLPPAQVLQTTTGPRTVRLADGSLVVLEPGSLLEVRLGPSERRLDLRAGRARFEVFHEARPFVVHAGGGQVLARGTVFEVGYAGARQVTVHLIEGTVDVTYPVQSEASGRSPGTRRLSAGQSLTFGGSAGQAGGAGHAPAPAAPRVSNGATLSGPAAVRDYESIALSDLVSAANRLSSLPIRLAGPALGERRVSGRFRIDDPMVLAERLALLFDLDLERRSDAIVLRSR